MRTATDRRTRYDDARPAIRGGRLRFTPIFIHRSFGRPQFARAISYPRERPLI